MEVTPLDVEEFDPSTATTLLDLPDSLILKVFSYLNKFKDIGSLAKTNWRFNGICDDEILWRNLFHRHFHVGVGLFPGPSCKIHPMQCSF